MPARLHISRECKGARSCSYMQSNIPRRLILVLFFSFLLIPQKVQAASAATIVRFHTDFGNIDIQMFDAQMPRTVTNFLNYVRTSRYNGTAVHRNSDTADVAGGPMRDFVIQGGGYVFTEASPIINFLRVQTDPAIADEPGGGVRGPSNVRGTIAMAKSGPNTVNSQWFINQGNNSILDDPTRGDGGFSAFGAILDGGMAAVDAIGALPVPRTNTFGFTIAAPFNDLPLRNFTGNKIEDIRVVNTVSLQSVIVLNSFIPLGDFSRDGVADATDLAILQSNLNQIPTGARLDKGDIDNDGDVDDMDLKIFNARGTFSIVDYNIDPITKAYTVQFLSQAGVNYSLQYKTTLAAGSQWSNVPAHTNRPGASVSTIFSGNLGDLPAASAYYLRIATVP